MTGRVVGYLKRLKKKPEGNICGMIRKGNSLIR